MTDNWQEITDPEELFKLKREGWEIEFRAHKTYTWRTWMGGAWQDDWLFQARPRQPKMKKVKSLCWRQASTGDLTWTDEGTGFVTESGWQRFPAGDIEGVVPDDH